MLVYMLFFRFYNLVIIFLDLKVINRLLKKEDKVSLFKKFNNIK